MNRTSPLLLFLLFAALFATAQPGAVDLSFNRGTGISSTEVYAIAIQPDDRILAGGWIDSFNGIDVRNLIRLEADGSSLDTTFHTGTGVSGSVDALALQTDGKILAGGEFAYYNGTPVGYMFRTNADGSLDTSFHMGTGFNSKVLSLFVQSDGKILAGGIFTAYDGSPAGSLIRLNTDGTSDTTFHPLSGADGSVEAIDIQPDNKIIIGGDFTHYDGDLVIRLTRLNPDGLRDTSFHASGNSTIVGVDAVIFDLAIEPLGKIVIGGNFGNIAFQQRKKLARMLPNGDLDGYFGQNLDGGNSEVFALKLLNDQKTLIGGNFTRFNNRAINRIARIDTLGEIDTTFNVGSGAESAIFAIGLQSKGKIVVAGDFKTYNGILKRKIARLYNCLTPQPDSIYGNGYALCAGTQQTFRVNAVSGTDRYEWTLPAGWSGTSDSTSIIATSNGSGGLVSVKAFSDSCGYSYATIRNIATVQPPGVDICLVTVDTASTHNIIIWEKPVTNLIDSFLIYREITSNTYSKIAAVAYSELSEYHDLDTNANPNTTSYRYKISVLDTCGAVSALSPYHNTIHLQNLGNGNFQWTFYQIEPGINPVTSFNVYRDDLGNGNFAQIGFVPGTNATFTDINFSSFPNSIYVVDVNWSISCNATRAVNTTRSNIRHRGTIDHPLLGIDDLVGGKLLLYPNPAEKSFQINFPNGLNFKRLEIYNSMGQKVLSRIYGNAADNELIDIEGFPTGFYTVTLEGNGGDRMRKILVH
jgi:uncharacterized delta-60 repeat protein